MIEQMTLAPPRSKPRRNMAATTRAEKEPTARCPAVARRRRMLFEEEATGLAVADTPRSNHGSGAERALTRVQKTSTATGPAVARMRRLQIDVKATGPAEQKGTGEGYCCTRSASRGSA